MTRSEELLARVQTDLRTLKNDIDELALEYQILIAQALKMEACIHGLVKDIEHARTPIDCAGQNCHACANPCEKYIEEMR